MSLLSILLLMSYPSGNVLGKTSNAFEKAHFNYTELRIKSPHQQRPHRLADGEFGREGGNQIIHAIEVVLGSKIKLRQVAFIEH